MTRNRLCTATAIVLVAMTGIVIALRQFADGEIATTFANSSLATLPAAERHLVEFLLLLPVAALVICVFRNLIGIASFGTFAPALIGLVFRDLQSLPGLAVFVALLLTGWLMRRALDRFHLLQVPRASVMLSLIVAMLVVFVVVANRCELAVTKYVSLFPVIILTGMVERFWLLEADDGAGSSFRTLLGTLVIAVSVALVASIAIVPRTLIHYPETLGLVVALQMLVGRYTGYRITELWRFREFSMPMTQAPEEALVVSQTLPWRRF
jgi:7 transmembrane helices usually fused to an inactive transglutaminase